MKILGVALVVLGVVALVYGGISYTKKEEVVDIGPVNVTRENRETIPLPPTLGALSLVGGLAILIVGRK